MVFKPKKKLADAAIEEEVAATKDLTIKELKTQLAKAEQELEEMKEDEEDYDDEDSSEEEEVEDDEEIEESPNIKQVKQNPKKETQNNNQLTAEEVIAAIEFNIARAGQLLQILK